MRGLVKELVGLGIERNALLEAAGISASTLRFTPIRLPWELVEVLIEAAEELTGDDRLGLHLANTHDLETLALPGILLFASRDLEDAARRILTVQRLWSDAYRGFLESDPPSFVFELLRPERPANVHLREQTMADLLIMIRQVTGVQLSPERVAFPHVRAGNIDEYEEFFGCSVEFGAERTQMFMRPEHMRLPIPTSNVLFARHFARQAEAELARLSPNQTLAERVRELLEADLEAQLLFTSSLESVAERLRTSSRTLQRSLGKEGTSFAKELEGVRRAAAERLFGAGHEIADVSWQLGYAEPAVFHRAFKRWTGETPERYRKSRRVRSLDDPDAGA